MSILRGYLRRHLASKFPLRFQDERVCFILSILFIHVRQNEAAMLNFGISKLQFKERNETKKHG